MPNLDTRVNKVLENAPSLILYLAPSSMLRYLTPWWPSLSTSKSASNHLFHRLEKGFWLILLVSTSLSMT